MSGGRLTAPGPLQVSESSPGRTTVHVEFTGDDPSLARQLSLDLVRVLPDEETPGLGSVEADWTLGDGSTARGSVAVR